jgi:release factor glutamine methyltransferase
VAEALARAGETVGEAVRRGTDRLAAAGCETPRLDTELLLADVLAPARPGGREQLVLDRDTVLDAEVREHFDQQLARRAEREPVAYILGRRDFRNISLTVDPRVLIPRPETELLVEVGLALPVGARVADVGTGSGAVALALADERPDLRVSGLDVDPAALTVARANAARLGLEVEFVLADLLGPGRYDAVLANLPYVAAGASLAPEIERYEPRAALYAGPDGLDLIRRLIPRAVDAGAGLLALEISPEQSLEVAALVLAAGLSGVEVLRDLAGHERVVVGRA